MKARFLCLCILLLSIPAAPSSAQQEKKPGNAPSSTKEVNAALIEARAANAEQRFQDAETLMLRVTQANPRIVPPWIELGNAQMGLKKYSDAENSFKIALGLKPAPENPATQASSPPAPDKAPDLPDKTPDLVEQYIRSLPLPGGNSGGLRPLGGASGSPPSSAGTSPSAPPPGAASSSSPAPGGAANPPAAIPTAGKDQSRPPQVLGPVYAGLGEVYAHEGKIAEAQAAFDEAVKQLPTEAADYRSNETIVFFQTGQGDAQFAAAKEAIALDPERPSLYYFEGQALVSKATVDPKTQKLTLPPECADAFQKYLKIAPNGRFAADVRGILAAGGVAVGK